MYVCVCVVALRRCDSAHFLFLFIITRLKKNWPLLTRFVSSLLLIRLFSVQRFFYFHFTCIIVHHHHHHH